MTTKAFVVQLPLEESTDPAAIEAEITDLLAPVFGDVKVSVWESPNERGPAVTSMSNFPTL